MAATVERNGISYLVHPAFDTNDRSLEMRRVGDGTDEAGGVGDSAAMDDVELGETVFTPPSLTRSVRGRTTRLAVAAVVLVLMSLVSMATYSHTVTTMADIDRPNQNALVAAALRPLQADPRGRKRFAYMFYITSDIYACAAIHFMRTLKDTVKMDADRIDLAVLHSPDISQAMLGHITSATAARLIPVETINADAFDFTWMASLTKLHAFREWGYDRVVYIDADSVPLHNLDHLFNMPPAPLYAPTAYWLTQPFFASTLMVIEPSNERFREIIAWARARGEAAGFDMDILNAFFQDTVEYLPGDYTVLNSDFRKAPSDETKLYATVAKLKQRAKLVHFSCTPDGSYGKPWSGIHSAMDLAWMREQGFDPLFAALFEDFWTTQQAFCLGVN